MRLVSKILILVLLLSVLNTVSATPTVVKIDSDKVLNISGKRTFPVYMYSLSSRQNATANGEAYEDLNTSLLKGRNFTFNAPYINPGPSSSNYPWYNLTISGFESNNNKVMWFADAHLGPNRPYITDWGTLNLSTFAGWYLPDEPAGSTGTHTLAELQKMHDDVKSADPNHIIVLPEGSGNDTKFPNTPDDIRYAEGITDVIQVDVYAHKIESYLISPSRKWWNTNGSVAAFERWAWQNAMGHNDSFTDYNQVSVPIWAAIQANAVHTEGMELMTYELIRATSYTAITMDVKGIGFYSYKRNYCLILDQNIFNKTATMAGELISFNDWLILPTHSFRWYKHNDTTNVTFSTGYTIPMPIYALNMPNFNFILKHQPGNNTWYLVVVNKGNTTVTNVNITVTPLVSSGSYNATMLGYEQSGSSSEHKTIPLSIINGVFTDSFDPYAAHVYKLSPKGSVPVIESWGNSKTNDKAVEVTVNAFESVTFNATANQAITTWNWYENNVLEDNTSSSYITSWSSTGTKTIKVNGTNANGTTDTVTWTIMVNYANSTKFGLNGAAWDSAGTSSNVYIENNKLKLGFWGENFDDGLYDWTADTGTANVSNGRLLMSGTVNVHTSKIIGNHSDVAMFATWTENVNNSWRGFSIRSDTSRGSPDMNYIVSGRPDGSGIWIVKYNGSAWVNVNETGTFVRTNGSTSYCIEKGYGSTFKVYCSHTSYADALANPSVSQGIDTQFAYGNRIRLEGNSNTEWDNLRIVLTDASGNLINSGSKTVYYDAGANNHSNGVIINATTPANTNYTISYRQKNVGSWIPMGGVYTGNQTLSINGTRYQVTEINITLFGNGTSFPDLETVEFIKEQMSSSIVYPRYDVNENGIVDINDLTLVGQYFNEIVPFPYPRYDVNMDGLVSIEDISIVGQHFGEIF